MEWLMNSNDKKNHTTGSTKIQSLSHALKMRSAMRMKHRHLVYSSPSQSNPKYISVNK